MAKTKKITDKDILSEYMTHVLEHGERPASIYAFSRSIGIQESQFYDSFGSFDTIEKMIFKSFFDNTMALLTKDKDYRSFDAKNKLLSFYYTFFEILKANRSYVLIALKGQKSRLKSLAALSELKKYFQSFIEDIEIRTFDFKQEKIEKIKKQGLKDWTWAQFLFTLNFWLDDNSAGFEKTDIFIEKSIATCFKLIENSSLESMIDLGKFLFKEKFANN